MKATRTLRRVVILGSLGIALIGLLAIYFAVATNLPTQIYSPAQMEFLSRNYLKSVYQMAPVLNALGAEGLVDGLVEALVLPWKTSHVQAYLNAHYEEFEGVSATVYELEFHGEYQLGSPDSTFTSVEIYFPFPNNLETFHEVEFLVDGEEPLGVDYSTQGPNHHQLPSGRCQYIHLCPAPRTALRRGYHHIRIRSHGQHYSQIIAPSNRNRDQGKWRDHYLGLHEPDR